MKISKIAGLNLDYVTSNPWVVMMVSALRGDKIPDVVDWLVKKSKKWKGSITRFSDREI